MRDAAAEPTELKLRAWIDAARGNTTTHDQRQIITIILNAVALIETFRTTLVLKGGNLLAIANGDPRQTVDLDFTARGDPTLFAETFGANMNQGLDRARARLGYAQWRCRVQGVVRKRPRPELFATATGPALEANIAYARVNSRDMPHLIADTCTHTIPIEISFREPMIDITPVRLEPGGNRIEVYSVNELLAEKYRA